MSREEFEAVDRIATAAGLVPPTTWWATRSETPGSGRTTTMALHVVAALKDGWTCWVAAENYPLAWAIGDMIEKIAEMAGVSYHHDFLQCGLSSVALRLQNDGVFDPEHKSALFLNHLTPGVEEAQLSCLTQQQCEQRHKMRTDASRAWATLNVSPFKATHRTSVNTVPVRTGPGPEDVEFHEETIHETLVDEMSGRLMQARWERTSEPTIPTQK